jgi:hypothetical protein
MSGARSFKNDHNRSIPLERFTGLLALDADFHCLQKEIREEDLPVFKAFPNLRPHGDAIHDFGDTAALVMEMDLVISVDTSIAHLVGALGQTLWLLLPYTPDNRWFLDRSDSPWYPTTRLFRQGIDRQWPPVFDKVHSELLSLL